MYVQQFVQFEVSTPENSPSYQSNHPDVDSKEFKSGDASARNAEVKPAKQGDKTLHCRY